MSTQWDATEDQLITGVLADAAEWIEDDQPAPPRRGRPITVKPPLRQPKAPTSQPLVRSESWWMTVPDRSGFTARAEAERARMGNDTIGRKVPDQINGKYIKQVGGGEL